MFAVRRSAQNLIASMASSSPLRGVAAFSTSSPGHAVKRIGTHDGSFHCVEALGCFMLRLTDKFAGAEIVRTRDPKVLDALDAVFDIGGIFDPEHDRYDHVGLVYKQYGLEIISKETQLDPGHPDVHRLFCVVFEIIMREIYGIGNEIDRYDTYEPARYLSFTDDSSVKLLNGSSLSKNDEAFDRAMALTGGEFSEMVRFRHQKMICPTRVGKLSGFKSKEERPAECHLHKPVYGLKHRPCV